jgi:hypothetical protein
MVEVAQADRYFDDYFAKLPNAWDVPSAYLGKWGKPPKARKPKK